MGQRAHAAAETEPVTSAEQFGDQIHIAAIAELARVGRCASGVRCGKSWAEIAMLLCVTRYAAWERWHADDEPPGAADNVI